MERSESLELLPAESPRRIMALWSAWVPLAAGGAVLAVISSAPFLSSADWQQWQWATRPVGYMLDRFGYELAACVVTLIPVSLVLSLFRIGAHSWRPIRRALLAYAAVFIAVGFVSVVVNLP